MTPIWHQSVSSVAQSCPPLCDSMDCSMTGLSVHHQLELAQTHVHRVSDTIQPSHPLPSPSPAFNFPNTRVFSNESVLHIQWPKFWGFSLNISLSNECSGLISFRIDWFDPLQSRELSSLLQHHSSRASFLQRSAFMAQLSHLYMTTGKTIALTGWTFVGKVMSLLFNMLSRFFIAFLPSTRCLLISRLHSPSAVILEPKKIKYMLYVCTCVCVYVSRSVMSDSATP